jgi:hypothetical protein
MWQIVLVKLRVIKENMMLRLSILFIGVTLFSSDFFYEYGKKVEVVPSLDSARSADTNSGVKSYKSADGREFILKHEVIVKLKDGVESDFFNQFCLKDIKKIAKSVYLVILTTDQDLFKMAQRLYRDENTIYAVPNKIQKANLR